MIVITFRAYCGNTPIHYAAMGGHVEALGILLSVSPAHIDSQNMCGVNIRMPFDCD